MHYPKHARGSAKKIHSDITTFSLPHPLGHLIHIHDRKRAAASKRFRLVNFPFRCSEKRGARIFSFWFHKFLFLEPKRKILRACFSGFTNHNLGIFGSRIKFPTNHRLRSLPYAIANLWVPVHPEARNFFLVIVQERKVCAERLAQVLPGLLEIEDCQPIGLSHRSLWQTRKYWTPAKRSLLCLKG